MDASEPAAEELIGSACAACALRAWPCLSAPAVQPATAHLLASLPVTPSARSRRRVAGDPRHSDQRWCHRKPSLPQKASCPGDCGAPPLRVGINPSNAGSSRGAEMPGRPRAELQTIAVAAVVRSDPLRQAFEPPDSVGHSTLEDRRGDEGCVPRGAGRAARVRIA